jgi:hypothetical protein
MGVDATTGQPSLEIKARLLLGELLMLEVQDRNVTSAEAAAELAATIELTDRQGLSDRSIRPRLHLLFLLQSVDANTVDRGNLQSWFDLARLPWADEFRIDDVCIQSGLLEASALAAAIANERQLANRLVGMVQVEHEFLRLTPLTGRIPVTVSADCAF